MAVAYSGTNKAARGTSSAQATASITVSGTNPVLLIGIAIDISGGNPTINSVTFGGTGTPTVVKDLTAGTVRTAVYCVPAPSGSGVITLNLSASKPVQLDVALFTGADQSNPCPTGDVASNQSTTGGQTIGPLTPTNLVSGDASFGAQGHTIATDATGVSPNNISSDSTTTVNYQDGYATNTTGVTFSLSSNSVCDVVSIVARIQQPTSNPEEMMMESRVMTSVP